MTARLVTALAGTVLAATVVGTLAVGTAHAATVGNGPNGQRLTVSNTTDLPVSGTTVTVSGSGYDTTKGVYVAFCVDNGAGAAPSPCGGGVDMSGSSGLSHWISSNPPSYGEGLAVPYGPGGTFRVRLRVSPRIGDVDCTVRRCVVSTRSDHSRSADRSQDVRVPVTFARTVATPTTAPPSAPRPTGDAPTADPPTTAPAGAGTTPAGAVTASAGAAAPAGTDGGGPGPSGAATDQLATQVTTTAGGDRWWTVVTAGLAVLLVVLVAVRLRNRRRERP